MLGALSLVVSAKVSASVDVAGVTGEDASALVLLGESALSVKELAEATGITHSGGVRMADRLASAGLVRREAGGDRRIVRLVLTPAGIEAKESILAARADALEPLLASLSPGDRSSLRGALTRLLGSAVDSAVEAVRTCRLCEERCCVPLGCPVEERYQRLTP